MAFNPDEYLAEAGGFNTDEYLAGYDASGDTTTIDANGSSIESDPIHPKNIVGAAEGVLQMGTGFVGDVAGGIAGLAASAIPGSEEGIGNYVSESVANTLTYQPRTQTGKDMMRALGNSYPVQKIAEITQAVEQFLANEGYEQNKGPLRTSLAVAMPAAIGQALGARLPSAAS